MSIVTAMLFAGSGGGDPRNVASVEAPPTPLPAQSSTSGLTVRQVKEHLCETYHYRPVRILVACGDGNARVVHLRWSEWSEVRAVGVGTWQQNDCRPDCADGTFHDYPVRLALTEPMGAGPRRFFGDVVADFARGAPPEPAYRCGHAMLRKDGREPDHPRRTRCS